MPPGLGSWGSGFCGSLSGFLDYRTTAKPRQAEWIDYTAARPYPGLRQHGTPDFDCSPSPSIAYPGGSEGSLRFGGAIALLGPPRVPVVPAWALGRVGWWWWVGWCAPFGRVRGGSRHPSSRNPEGPQGTSFPSGSRPFGIALKVGAQVFGPRGCGVAGGEKCALNLVNCAKR